jgi:hypothetical protein
MYGAEARGIPLAICEILRAFAPVADLCVEVCVNFHGER